MSLSLSFKKKEKRISSSSKINSDSGRIRSQGLIIHVISDILCASAGWAVRAGYLRGKGRFTPLSPSHMAAELKTFVR